ncbi:retinol dehydrogenase 12-like isoform X2 [Sinocyclocheilus grahami]|uniref:retinol dehydrogenase 12-like isoform X2 n=1 Tax=Sinocyclocheilus grahami TaxID=75366 RepID=UPI0007ACDBD6|nr:PREDICTED: retinol dehydrogenase 12-like isoform X2 [Sinocyclocheilus grahami]
MNVLRGLFTKSWSSDIQLDGKTAIVTGANTGIGKETAKDLAKRGARVILACRDLLKAEQAAREISRDVENASVVVRKLDLADTKSICDFAELIYNTEKSLHLLINNAGVAICPYSTTADGFETQFGVNHLGHFFLTFLLMDLLKHSAPSRVINVSSLAHPMGKIHFEDLNSEKSYHPVKAYVQSKLANILFTRELATRVEGSSVTVYSLHPGVVQSELFRNLSKPVQIAVKVFSPFTKTTIQGAQTTIYCAVEPKLDNESGGYYSDCAAALCSGEALDDEMAQKLWELSCQMLGITWD